MPLRGKPVEGQEIYEVPLVKFPLHSPSPHRRKWWCGSQSPAPLPVREALTVDDSVAFSKGGSLPPLAVLHSMGYTGDNVLPSAPLLT